MKNTRGRVWRIIVRAVGDVGATQLNLAKMIGLATATTWLHSEGRIVHGWALTGRGKVKTCRGKVKPWTVAVREITFAGLPDRAAEGRGGSDRDLRAGRPIPDLAEPIT